MTKLRPNIILIIFTLVSPSHHLQFSKIQAPVKSLVSIVFYKRSPAFPVKTKLHF